MGPGPAADDDLVWYAAYGSNLSLDRFLAYLRGGRPATATGPRPHRGARDPTPPRTSLPGTIDHPLHFARRSAVWGGGVAFISRQRVAGARTLVRLHLVTRQQLEDVFAQESGRATVALDVAGLAEHDERWVSDGWYGCLLRCGTLRERPVLTFTAPSDDGAVPVAEPSPAYVRTIAVGLGEAFGLSPDEVAGYLVERPGLRGRRALGEVAAWAAGEGAAT